MRIQKSIFKIPINGQHLFCDLKLIANALISIKSIFGSVLGQSKIDNGIYFSWLAENLLQTKGTSAIGSKEIFIELDLEQANIPVGGIKKTI